LEEDWMRNHLRFPVFAIAVVMAIGESVADRRRSITAGRFVQRCRI
jgi:hypothetical protein